LKFSYLPVIALFFVSSCTWYRNLQRSLVEDEEKNQPHAKSVSREQYDQLLVKYEELSKKYQLLREGAPADSLTDELQGSRDQISQVETVDIFAGAADQAIPQISADVESQLNLYRRGLSLKASNQVEATKIFQQLQTQGVPAIRVRAKYQIGEMLLGKGQYDLALQIFEDVINKHAHSGVVMDALRYAVTASEKLGLNSKRDQYASMLNDVFEAN
jgi:TolA-binding protein